MYHFGSIEIKTVCRHGHGQSSHPLAGTAKGRHVDLFQTQTYSAEDAILEIDLDASRNVLDLVPMINLAEVDANLQSVRQRFPFMACKKHRRAPGSRTR